MNGEHTLWRMSETTSARLLELHRRTQAHARQTEQRMKPLHARSHKAQRLLRERRRERQAVMRWRRYGCSCGQHDMAGMR